VKFNMKSVMSESMYTWGQLKMNAICHIEICSILGKRKIHTLNHTVSYYIYTHTYKFTNIPLEKI